MKKLLECCGKFARNCWDIFNQYYLAFFMSIIVGFFVWVCLRMTEHILVTFPK